MSDILQRIVAVKREEIAAAKATGATHVTDDALALISELKGAALLDGVRGAKPADKKALAELMADFGQAIQKAMNECNFTVGTYEPADPGDPVGLWIAGECRRVMKEPAVAVRTQRADLARPFQDRHRDHVEDAEEDDEQDDAADERELRI